MFNKWVKCDDWRGARVMNCATAIPEPKPIVTCILAVTRPGGSCTCCSSPWMLMSSSKWQELVVLVSTLLFHYDLMDVSNNSVTAATRHQLSARFHVILVLSRTNDCTNELVVCGFEPGLNEKTCWSDNLWKNYAKDIQLKIIIFSLLAKLYTVAAKAVPSGAFEFDVLTYA